MSVKVVKVKNNKVIGTYFLNKKEFVKFIQNKVQTAKAIKAAKADIDSEDMAED